MNKPILTILLLVLSVSVISAGVYMDVTTEDGRVIEVDNFQQMFCELNEVSDINCPTYSADTCVGGSWFIS